MKREHIWKSISEFQKSLNANWNDSDMQILNCQICNKEVKKKFPQNQEIISRVIEDGGE